MPILFSMFEHLFVPLEVPIVLCCSDEPLNESENAEDCPAVLAEELNAIARTHTHRHKSRQSASKLQRLRLITCLTTYAARNLTDGLVSSNGLG